MSKRTKDTVLWVRQAARVLVLVHPGDDWHPCYPGGHVEVRLGVRYGNGDADGDLVWVSVWGADDTGVERVTDLADGLDLYARLTHNTCPPRASMLGRWGFRRA